MFDFFRGWKRKAGCVTLVGACVLTILWIVTTKCSFHLAAAVIDPVQFLSVKDGYVRLASYRNVYISKMFAFEIGLPTRPYEDIIDSPGMQKDLVWQWHWKQGGFEFGHSPARGVKIWAVPFSVIVIPLTLLSAWLLFSKGKEKEKKKVPGTKNVI